MTVQGIKRRIFLFFVNYCFAGTRCFSIKRSLLNAAGFSIGNGTKVVGPIECTAKLSVGSDCWIGKNFVVNGNGTVIIGDRCDIAPEVILQTGGHEIGDAGRRAGKGKIYDVVIGEGCWIGARSTLLGGVYIGNGAVVAACACVNKDIPSDVLVGGVPARVIRNLENAENTSSVK